jgi:hypothetical protein
VTVQAKVAQVVLLQGLVTPLTAVVVAQTVKDLVMALLLMA